MADLVTIQLDLDQSLVYSGMGVEASPIDPLISEAGLSIGVKVLEEQGR